MDRKSKIDPFSRNWDAFSALLLFLLLQILAGRLTNTKWIENLNIVAGFIIPALILGLLLGYAKLPGWAGWGIAFFHGLVAVSTLLGVLYAPGFLWIERLIIIYERVIFSIYQLLEHAPLEDPILFFTTVSALFWILAVTAGFLLTRRGSAIFVVITTTILFVIIDRYDLANKLRSFYYFVFLFTAFMLVMRSNLMENQKRWKKNQILVPPGVNFELTRTAGILLLAVLTIIWVTPVVSKVSDPAARLWRQMTRPLDGTRETFANAFNSLKSSSAVRSIQFYDTLQIGTSTPQETTVLFSIKAFGRDPLEQRYYWRTRSYSIYDNGYWRSSIDQELDLNNAKLIPAAEEWAARKTYTFQVTAYSELTKMLITEQSPYLVSIPEYLFGLEVAPGVVDVDHMQPIDPLERGVSYRVSSMKSVPAIPQLEKTNDDYPNWVKESYLSLPQNINPMVKELAMEIIHGKENPYDQVDSITNYLRRNYRYMSNLPPTIEGDEPIDVFLFEDKQGFCNHFATAEVLLLRSIGIPARLTVGFAEGELVEENELYVVRMKDTHAWPEVYFNEYGWVIFEPTTNQTPIVYEETLRQNDRTLEDEIGNLNAFQDMPDLTMDETAPISDILLKRQTFQSTQNFLAIIILLILSAGICALLFFFLLKLPEISPSMPLVLEKSLRKTGITPPSWLSWWAVYNKRTTLEQMFLLPDVMFGLLKKPYQPARTINERVKEWVKELPEIKPYAIILQSEYENVIYGDETGNPILAKQASQKIQKMIIFTAISRVFQPHRKQMDD